MKKSYFKGCFALVLMLIAGISKGQSYTVDTISWNGNENKRINIVVLGDGYTSGELDKFNADARKISRDLFAEVPFSNYESFFNVLSIAVASNVSGAANDPSMLIDNYYGSSFNVSGIQRLLVPMRSWRVTELLANAFPSFDQVIMLVNDNRYGGSGGWIATSSTHPTAGEIAIHEIGHSFSRLSDEYYAGDQFARETANMTRETDPQRVKWKNWMGFQGVGIFQHCCNGNSAQWYRPHQNCKMRSLGVPFCSVCRETTIARTYQLVSFLDDFSPKTSPVALENEAVRLQTYLIYPQPSSLQIQWFINSDRIENYEEDYLLVSTNMLSDGNNVIVCNITDTTDLVRINGHSNQIFKEVSWTIERLNTSIQIADAADHEWKVWVFPNPASTYFNLQWNKDLSGLLEIDLYASNGLLFHRTTQMLNSVNLIEVTLPPQGPTGIYQILLRLNGRAIGSKTVMCYGE
jgi:hypothetical protein